MKPELAMALSSVVLMALASILAYVDNRLFPGQMMVHHATRGYPGVANGSLYVNILVMSFVMYCMGLYWHQWTGGYKAVAIVVGMGFAIYAFMQIYRTGLHDDAWAGAGEMHPAGMVAMFYTGIVLAVSILFYVFSSVDRNHVWVIGALLLIYVPVANHLPLNALNEAYQFIWCPRIFAEEARPWKIFVGGEIGVGVLTGAKLLFPQSWWSLVVKLLS